MKPRFVWLFCLAILHSILQVPNALGRDATAAEYLERPHAELAILDKITARVKTLTLAVGEEVRDGRLKLTLARCVEAPPEFTPEAMAYVTLVELLDEQVNITELSLFSGWMFASSPGLSAVEHPVYDVWLTKCLEEASPVRRN